jgi:hypothetical protein
VFSLPSSDEHAVDHLKSSNTFSTTVDVDDATNTPLLVVSTSLLRPSTLIGSDFQWS